MKTTRPAPIASSGSPSLGGAGKPRFYWLRRVLPELLLLIAVICSLGPYGLLAGKWVDDSGEVWQIRRDRSIVTNNPRWPHRSFRWNLYPIAIHLFYEPKQRAPHGPFHVLRGWDTLTLQPAWRTGGSAPLWTFHRMPDPTRHIVPGLFVVLAIVAALYRRRSRRNESPKNA